MTRDAIHSMCLNLNFTVADSPNLSNFGPDTDTVFIYITGYPSYYNRLFAKLQEN